MKKQFQIVVTPTGRTFRAYAPDVPECVATGRTIESTKNNLRKAIRRHLAGLIADGKPVPQPQVALRYVEVDDSKFAKRKAG